MQCPDDKSNRMDRLYLEDFHANPLAVRTHAAIHSCILYYIFLIDCIIRHGFHVIQVLWSFLLWFTGLTAVELFYTRFDNICICGKRSNNFCFKYSVHKGTRQYFVIARFFLAIHRLWTSTHITHTPPRCIQLNVICPLVADVSQVICENTEPFNRE